MTDTKKKGLRYYVEVKHPETGERIAGELIVKRQLSPESLTKKVAEFYSEQGICGSYAAENFKYKTESV